MAIDTLQAAAGQVVLLAQMLLQHPPAEAGLVPGDLLALAPGLEDLGSADQLQEVHRRALSPRARAYLGWRITRARLVQS